MSNTCLSFVDIFINMLSANYVACNVWDPHSLLLISFPMRIATLSMSVVTWCSSITSGMFFSVTKILHETQRSWLPVLIDYRILLFDLAVFSLTSHLFSCISINMKTSLPHLSSINPLLLLSALFQFVIDYIRIQLCYICIELTFWCFWHYHYFIDKLWSIY